MDTQELDRVITEEKSKVYVSYHNYIISSKLIISKFMGPLKEARITNKKCL